MDEDWWSRLQRWKENTEKSLKKRWYLWPLSFAVDLFWHRIDSEANDFLDTHGLGKIASITKHIPSDPVALAVVTAIVILLGLAAHAYYETRPAKRLSLLPEVPYDRKLTIRRAFYGMGDTGGDDCDVTLHLRDLSLNALAVRVQNEIAHRDPAMGEIKRLRVEYSYGNEQVRSVIRKEGDLLVIPEPSTVVPAVGMALDYVVMEPYDFTPGRHYPRKVRIYFRENAGDRISIGRGTWLRDSVDIQKHQPFACYYQLETSPRVWAKEEEELIIEPKRRMRLYVGLDSSITEEEAQRLTSDGRLGTIMIPADVLGISVIFKIKL